MLEPGRLRFEGLPRGTWLRVAHTCPGQAKLRRLVRRGRAVVKSVTVKRDRLGRWWATITYQQQVAVLAQPETSPAGDDKQGGGERVGVDLGVKTVAVAATSDGALVAETATEGRYKAQLRQLARAQRTVSRRTRPGKGVKQSANRTEAQRR